MTRRARPIKLKRVYQPRSPDDGLRVLVDRLCPRGVTKQDAAADLWLNDAARRQQPVTLLFAAADEAHSHAVVLREVLEEGVVQ